MGASITLGNSTKSITTGGSTASVSLGDSSKSVNLNFTNDPYSSDATTVFARFPNDPPAALKDIMATFIDAQVANGNWALLKQFILYCMDTEANSLIDWLGFANATNSNSTTHTPWSGAAHSGFAGFSPDGATKFINNNLAPDDMSNTDCFAGIWLYTIDNPATVKFVYGSGDLSGLNSFFHHFQRGSATISGARANLNSATAIEDSNKVFLNANSLHLVESNTPNNIIKRNGSTEVSESNAIRAANPYSMYVGGENREDSLLLPVSCNVTAWVAGKTVGFDHANFYADLLTMLQSLGIES